jgi:DNA-binding response OmpR family regulator
MMTHTQKPLAIIIEDDDSLGLVAYEALRTAGFYPELISDGLVAQERLAVAVPAIIILDLHLPQVSGQELLRQIKKDHRLRDTQIIIATADPATAGYLQEEVDLVLIKPYSFSQLRDFAVRLRSVMPVE